VELQLYVNLCRYVDMDLYVDMYVCRYGYGYVCM